MTATASPARRLAHEGKQKNDADEQHFEQQEHIGNGHRHRLTPRDTGKL